MYSIATDCASDSQAGNTETVKISQNVSLSDTFHLIQTSFDKVQTFFTMQMLKDNDVYP